MKSRLPTLCFFVILAFNCSANETLNCIDGKIKYFEGKSEVISKESYCYNSVDKTISSSIKCAKAKDKDKECLSENTNPILIKSSALNSTIGSPGFMICKSIDGVPQIMEYWDSKNWIPSARCLFKDKSFIDLGSLSVKVKYVE